jgi:hypothetical protein
MPSTFDDIGWRPDVGAASNLIDENQEASMASQAQIAANRRNGSNSTGPRTAEGKERARLNGLKHGLRAEQVVLPTEDPAAFESYLKAWKDDWQAPSEARSALVERAAVASWRLKRCVRVESARLSERIEIARGRWDRGKAQQVEQALVRLRTEPNEALDQLEESLGGIDRLLDFWNDLEQASDDPDGWNDIHLHHFRLVNLQGYLAGDDQAGDFAANSWRLYLRSNLEIAEAEEVEPLDDAAAEAFRNEIRTLCQTECDRLRVLREDVPGDSSQRDREAELDAFMPRVEDAALLRYEGQFDRVLRASITELSKLSRTGDDLVSVEDIAPTEANPAPARLPAPTEANPPPLKDKAKDVPAPTEANPPRPLLVACSPVGFAMDMEAPLIGGQATSISPAIEVGWA